MKGGVRKENGLAALYCSPPLCTPLCVVYCMQDPNDRESFINSSFLSTWSIIFIRAASTFVYLFFPFFLNFSLPLSGSKSNFRRKQEALKHGMNATGELKITTTSIQNYFCFCIRSTQKSNGATFMDINSRKNNSLKFLNYSKLIYNNVYKHTPVYT